MAKILFPESFPTIELMMDMLQKTFQQSWKVDLDCDDIKEWLLNFNGQFYDVIITITFKNKRFSLK